MGDVMKFDKEALHKLVGRASDEELLALERVALEAIEHEEGSDDDGNL
jgi:hypothetical protein